MKEKRHVSAIGKVRKVTKPRGRNRAKSHAANLKEGEALNAKVIIVLPY